MVVQELVARDSEVQEALADTPEAVQKIAQAGPVTVDGRITPSTSASEPRVRAFHARGSSVICLLSSAPFRLHIPPVGLVIRGLTPSPYGISLPHAAACQMDTFFRLGWSRTNLAKTSLPAA